MFARNKFTARHVMKKRCVMFHRFGCGLFFFVLGAGLVHAQDVTGIEICTAEKTMERRTSCLQSNVDFLMRAITKLSLDHQQKIDASSRQIDALKATVAGLQKKIDDLQVSKDAAAKDSKD